MSSDFDTKLVYDSRLNDIADKITYAVQKGSSNNTYQHFNANSATASGINFTVNPPSESTVIDRHMLIQSEVYFSIEIGDGIDNGFNVGTDVWLYGNREAMQSFPLSRLFTNCTVSINNVSSSIALDRVLPALVRMLDKEFMQKYNGMTPTYPDNYAEHSSSVGASNSPLNSFSGGGYNDLLQPRGAHQIQDLQIQRYDLGVFAGNSPVSQNITDTWIINIGVKLTEPLFVSPFIFGDPKFNQSGFLGINNFQLVMNIDGAMRRFWSSALPASRYNLSLGVNPGNGAGPVGFGGSGPFANTKLLCNFLTAPIPMVLPPKSVLPYSSYVAYETTNLSTLAAGASIEVNINSIQFEVVPDKLLIFARRRLSDQNALNTDTFMECTKFQCTFANKSGILSNATQEDLHLLSRKNGSQMDWRAFSGRASLLKGAFVSTAGSLLVLDPSMDFGLDSPYLANGSIGQFNLSARLTITNRYTVNVIPEMVVIAVRSGVVVTSAGQSTLSNNMLNSSIVSDTIEGDRKPMGSESYQRLVGGSQSASDMPSPGEVGGSRSGGSRSAGKTRSKLASLAL